MKHLGMHFTLSNLKKSTHIKEHTHACICKFTFATVTVSKPRDTTLITVTSLLDTRMVIQTVSTAVVNTVVSIGAVITFYNRYFVLKKNIFHLLY